MGKGAGLVNGSYPRLIAPKGHRVENAAHSLALDHLVCKHAAARHADAVKLERRRKR